MPGTIGNTAFASSAVVDNTWTVDSPISAPFQYTATTGDVVTQFSVYAAATAGGSPTFIGGVYVFSGGNPTTLVGTITINVGATAGWYTGIGSIALTNGVVYVAAGGWYNGTGYTAYYTSPGGSVSVGHAALVLPSTWSTTIGPWGDAGSYYATVTAGGSPQTWTGSSATMLMTGSAATAVGVGAGTATWIQGTTATELMTGSTGAFIVGLSWASTGGTMLDTGTTAAFGATGAGTWVSAGATMLMTGTPGVFPTPSGAYPRPASISGRKVLDQNGNVFLYKPMSSWGMATLLSNAEITTALQGVAANRFNGVTVWIGGGYAGGSGWPGYQNSTGQNFWSGAPYNSGLGPAWASTDWVVSECNRLGLVATLSFNAFSCGGDWSALTNANMQATGVLVANRYVSAINIVWHVMFDANPGTGQSPATTVGQRVEALFAGINSVEGGSRPFRWMEGSRTQTTANLGWLAAPNFHPVNAYYEYGSNSAEIVETSWNEAGATTVPTGDCEPPYDGSPHYPGDMAQQLRERSYSVFLEGASYINYGHEDFWRFGAQGGYTEGLTWQQVAAHNHTIQQSYAWSLVDSHVADTAWAPTSSFVTTGEGSGETKAAIGVGTLAAVAYFPNTRASVVVDTTVIPGTAPVRLRWYDPTTGAFTLIATSEAQVAGRSVTYPGNHGDGTSDWVLTVNVPNDQTWAGSNATIAVTGTTGVLALGDQFWSGSIVTMVMVSAGGVMTPTGTVAWTSTGATMTMVGQSGLFVPSSSPQTWPSGSATMRFSGTSGGAIVAGFRIKVGTTAITKVYEGTAQISKVYLGSTQL